jgi:hypothetical protein
MPVQFSRPASTWILAGGAEQPQRTNYSLGSAGQSWPNLNIAKRWLASVPFTPHSNGGTMEYRQGLAYPLLGYQILKNPEQPTIVAIAFDKEAGPSLFAATRDILEELAEAFHRQASNMPRRKDQN